MPNYLRMGRSKDENAVLPVIKWTAHERESVAAEALKIHTANPDISPYACAIRAQNSVLPESRRRPLHSTPAAKVEKWLTPIWDELRAAIARADASAAARRDAEALFIEIPAAP